jgi:putative ATP-dependent endonuclease of the OLD family
MKLISLSIRNYRTIEGLDLEFPTAYTAICGPNDSGKTNVIRAIRSLIQEEESPFFPTDDEPVAVKNDYPKWSDTAQDKRAIDIALTLAVDKDRDAGLYQFIVRQLSLEYSGAVLTFSLAASYLADRPTPTVKVKVGEQVFDGLEAQEVLKKLQTSRSILFHNSTQPDLRFRYREGFGQVREISEEGASILDGMKKDIDKRLKRIAKGQQQEIENLLGRLEAKYKVGLSLPSIDLSWLGFNITLGESKFDVPLDSWGSGTQNRTLTLLTLFRAKRISESEASASKITPLIVIEEPESFLHPYAQAEFGRVLQDIAEEFQVQVVVTTHSPYLLSLDTPEANILLRRRSFHGQSRETQRVDTAGEHWMEPFGQALGMHSEEFKPWRRLLSTKTEAILLVEGDTDREYFELLRHDGHAANRLALDGEIIPYEGAGTLKNTVLLRFIKNRYKRLFVTFDMDVQGEVERSLAALGLKRDSDYCAIGIDAAGKRCIEGLLPDKVRTSVYASNPDLVLAATSGTAEEQRRAKGDLKRLLLKEFKTSCVPGDHFKAFYPFSRLISKKLS